MVVCFLCRSSKNDDIRYGEMLQNKKMAVHTFCLYFSSNLSQNGQDDEGFLGFLVPDIRKEAKRVSALNCFYCRKSHANVGCCEVKCRRAYHLVCGIDNETENQFCGSFLSYCRQHARKRNTTQPAENAVCVICYDTLHSAKERYNHRRVIQAPCCRNGWFHKLCLQRFAKTSGYFFKCPLCNDAKTFRQKLPIQGIFIPNQDAAWELEPNAFSELLERPNECAAIECQCKQGRNHSSSNNPFIFCSTCGSTAMHSHCITNRVKSFHCADCTIAMEEDSGRESFNLHAHNYGNDEYIDVCNVSDKEDLEIIHGLLTSTNESPEEEGDNENRAQNSDTSDEEEIINSSQRIRHTRLLSSDTNSSDNSKENRPPPSTCSKKLNNCEKAKQNQTSSCNITNSPSCNGKLNDNPVSTSDNSENSTEHCPTSSRTTSKLPCNRKNSKDYRLPSRRSTSLSSCEDEPMVLFTQRRNRKLRISRVSQNSISSIKYKTEQSSSTEESSDDEIFTSKTQRSYISISSDDSNIPKTVNKRVMRLQSDDDDEVNTIIPRKHTKLHSNSKENSNIITKHNRKSVDLICPDSTDDGDDIEFIAKSPKSNTKIAIERDSAVAELSSSADSDDDPLENFTKILEKEKNKSCIAQRTRTRSVYVENPLPSCSSSIDRTKCCPLQIASGSKSSILPEKKKENLNISCIAQRTRRKSLYCETIQEKNAGNNVNKAHGERKTICSETAFEKKKQPHKHNRHDSKQQIRINPPEEPTEITPDQLPFDQMSRIYEKEDDTDENAGLSDAQQQQQGYCKALEISCIANRTRKRKSIEIQNVIEIDEPMASSKFYRTNFRYNRCRVLSTSSEDSTNVYTNAAAKLSQPPFKTNDKWPKQNYDLAFHKPRLNLHNSSSSYHPNNVHHPHISNRKRV